MIRALVVGLVVVATAIGILAAVTPAGASDGTAGVTVPTTPEGEPICVTCHESVSRNVVETWRSQSHGANQVGCPVCHNSHDQGFTPHPQASVCLGCHVLPGTHPSFTPDVSAARCMECHTGNVHWRADSSSWFYSGLPREDLTGSNEETVGVSTGAGRAAGAVVVVVALIIGLAVGFVADRFVRDL